VKEAIEKTRAWTGLISVIAAIAGVVGLAIAAAIVLGDDESTIAITTAAFGVISTMVTAYLGIKATANTAKEIAGVSTGDDGDGTGKDPPDHRPARGGGKV
jgi:uncharacterized protein YacL